MRNQDLIAARARRGFTLIELLTVIMIIGVLASILLGVLALANKRANKAATQSMFVQWASAIAGYKGTYSFYPDLGTGYTAQSDTYYTLDDGEQGRNLVRALSGKNPDGTALTDSERKKFNPRGREFCTFPSEVFLDNDPKKAKLADRFGNTRIRVVLDTDSDSMLTLKEKPENTTDLGLVNGNKLQAKIFICTLKADGADFEDIFVKN
ncbi:MAG: type II secretion system GspH family protein [Puniceicoccales bacterium]|jgi:prepilin-type N-terminal cleavage/methylation domain-containing protein|nr:type II secretion system GspH family protein [Puniceicoccales bacterium]